MKALLEIIAKFSRIEKTQFLGSTIGLLLLKRFRDGLLLSTRFVSSQ